MVKDIDINVTYKDKNHLINCQQHEFPDKILEKFNINVKDVNLYAVVKNQRYPITPKDVRNLMKIEMVNKRRDQRTSENHLGDNSILPKPYESIVKKLTINSALTGIERKSLIEFIDHHVRCEKRKLNENDDEVVPTKITAMIHRKIQVDMKSYTSKESVTQTDHVDLTFDKPLDNAQDICYQMRRLAHSNPNTEEAMLLMAKSFNDRRKFIYLESPPVALVKERYELLFTTSEVKRELDRLNFPGKCAEFLKNMEIYAPIILKHCNQSDEIFIRTTKMLDRVKTPHQKKYAQLVGSVFALAKLLEEDFRFIHLSDYPHGSDDMYPYIDASCHTLKQLFFDDIMYHIYVEGVLLCDAADFPEAILCLMAAFFIFNINYPASCHRTLTVLEKLYLCVSDTKEMDAITEQMVKYLHLQAKQRK